MDRDQTAPTDQGPYSLSYEASNISVDDKITYIAIMRSKG